MRGLENARISNGGPIVIHADQDGIPLAEALRLYDWLPNAELAVMPGHDHLRVISDATVFAALVTDFVTRHAEA